MEILESRLKERLVTKYGDKCSKCGQTEDLVIGHIDGQAYLELAYFKTPEIMWDYYHKNFDRESAFIMLVCKKCKEIIPSPQHPTLPELGLVLNEFDQDGKSDEMEKLITKYPHVIQFAYRITEMYYSVLKEEAIRRGLNVEEFEMKE